MSDDFDLDTHCVVCRQPRGSHPTESNNPSPLYDEGRACRDCDSYITAVRIQTMGFGDYSRHIILHTVRNFLSLSAGIKETKRLGDEMMQAEMTRLEAEETARNEDHGVLLDDGEEEGVRHMKGSIADFNPEEFADDYDDSEEDWS